MAPTQPTVTLKQIAAELAEKHSKSKKEVETILDDMIGLFGKNLKKGNRIRSSGPRHHASPQAQCRPHRPQPGHRRSDPDPGEEKMIAFRVAKDLKEAVL